MGSGTKENYDPNLIIEEDYSSEEENGNATFGAAQRISNARSYSEIKVKPCAYTDEDEVEIGEKGRQYNLRSSCGDEIFGIRDRSMEREEVSKGRVVKGSGDINIIIPAIHLFN